MCDLALLSIRLSELEGASLESQLFEKYFFHGLEMIFFLEDLSSDQFINNYLRIKLLKNFIKI
jgi:hypothetical protein